MGNSRQHALIAFLAEQEGKSGRLGKKAVQKLIHILTSVSGKRFGYNFSFYTYGAYSSALASDIEVAGALGLINISFNSSENSYSIEPSSRTASFVEKYLPEADKNSCLDAWRNFSGRSGRELELISTVLFLYDEELIPVPTPSMTDRVLELKPKYSKKEVDECQRELCSLYEL